LEWCSIFQVINDGSNVISNFLALMTYSDYMRDRMRCYCLYVVTNGGFYNIVSGKNNVLDRMSGRLLGCFTVTGLDSGFE